MKVWLAVLALLLGFLMAEACSGSDLWQWSPPAAHHAAVCLVRTDSGRETSEGSGCYVRIGQWAGVLTAKHCVEGVTCSVIWPDGYQVSAAPLVDAYGSDVALIQAGHPTLQPLRIADQEPTVGEWLELCGYGGAENRLRHYWGRLNSSGDNAEYSAAVMQGDSGGPVINQRLEVVGVIAYGSGAPVRYLGAAATFGQAGGPAWKPIRAFVTRCEQRYGGLFIGGVRGSCPGGSCPGGSAPSPAPSPGGSAWAYPPQQAGPQQSAVPPLAPPLVPVAPQQQEPPLPALTLSVDYDRLAVALSDIIASDPRFRGPPGPAGPAGLTGPAGAATAEVKIDQAALAKQITELMASDPRFRGPPGPAGQAGTPGTAAPAEKVDVDSLAAAVAAKLPPIYFRKVNAATGAELSAPEPVRLGEGFTFRITPAK
jgi:hypothetical protein